MEVWLVNPFDPLPGEQEQLGRYADIALSLRQSGHDVVWWSSLFSHRFKRQVDPDRVGEGAERFGIEVCLVPAPAYSRNVSLGRLWNHWLFGRRFGKLARRRTPPDLIVASSPPLESACKAAELGTRWNVPVVVDIQDQWPDSFVHVMPRFARGLGRLLLAPYYAVERKAYRLATGIIGVAQGYVDRGVAVGGAKRHLGMFPLGVNLEELRAAIARGTAEATDRWTKPPGHVWLAYTGSLSHGYDFLTILRAAALAKERYGDRVRFFLTGRGELADAGRRIVREQALTNVCMTGFLEFPEWAYLLSQVDAGFNASFPDALIYLPNKIFYYMAVGAAVLNTIPGQCAELVDRHRCGLDYTAGDVAGCFEAVRTLVDSPDLLAEMGASARRLAEEQFDRRFVYAELTRFLEGLGGHRCAG